MNIENNYFLKIATAPIVCVHTQQTHTIEGISLQRRCNIMMLQQRCFEVVCLLGNVSESD